jgi:hypothetical protein
MHKALLSALLLAACMSSCRAADPRLAQRVTYQGGYKRLHAVAEELTRQTGVTIRAGLSREDWRVRDVPLIVCIKDMPLGKLLNTLADTAHATFAVDKSPSAVDGMPVYRLYRTKQQQDEITKALDARVEANRKLALWAWDTLVAYAKMPDASSDIKAVKTDVEQATLSGLGTLLAGAPVVDGTSARQLAKALAALGPNARAKFAAGDEINLWVRNNAAVSALYDYAIGRPMTRESAIERSSEALQPTDAERAEAYFAVKLVRQEKQSDEGAFQCQIFGIPVEDTSSRFSTYWVAAPVRCAKALAAVEKLHLPQPPDTKAAFEPDKGLPGPGFKRLAEDADYNVEPFQTKITLDLPKASRPSNTRGELLIALCKASGLSVVCEDFASQKLPDHWLFPGDATRADNAGYVLKSIAIRKDVVWFFDSDSKLVVGWADDWRKHHQALVAESLLAGIRAKRESRAGAELDDVVALWELTTDQIAEWIDETPDWAGVYFANGATAAMWRIYNRLTTEQKALANSPDGLPIGSLDVASVMKLYNQTKKETEETSLAGWASEEEPHTKLRRQYFADANLADKLVLNVEPMLMDFWLSSTVSDYGAAEPSAIRRLPDLPPKHTYEIRLTNPTLDDDMLNLRTQWSLPFPLFTPEHEAELIKKAESNAAEKK